MTRAINRPGLPEFPPVIIRATLLLMARGDAR